MSSSSICQTGSSTLDRYVADVSSLVHSQRPMRETVALIAKANEELLAIPDFRVPDALRVLQPGVPYTRNLVYASSDKRFSIMALVWGPHQETQVHDHLNWCVVGILEGRTMTVDYERLDDETVSGEAELRIRSAGVYNKGDVASLLPPPRTNIHKMCNAGRNVAISLHTYGDPGTKARVYDVANGKVGVRDLRFHNEPTT